MYISPALSHSPYLPKPNEYKYSYPHPHPLRRCHPRQHAHEPLLPLYLLSLTRPRAPEVSASRLGVSSTPLTSSSNASRTLTSEVASASRTPGGGKLEKKLYYYYFLVVPFFRSLLLLFLHSAVHACRRFEVVGSHQAGGQGAFHQSNLRVVVSQSKVSRFGSVV
jgi:hypothetical protein